MEVEIKITIKPKRPNEYSESDLMTDLKLYFTDITGYETHDIEIN